MFTSLHGDQLTQVPRNPPTPPFWQLEALIVGGCDLEIALALIAARASDGSMASRWLCADAAASRVRRSLAC